MYLRPGQIKSFQELLKFMPGSVYYNSIWENSKCIELSLDQLFTEYRTQEYNGSDDDVS
jgi:hypothetical protein